METVETDEIEALDEEIESLKKVIETAGEIGRSKLKDIQIDLVLAEIPRDPTSKKIDEAAWEQIDEVKKYEVFHRLTLVQKSLQGIIDQDGPSDQSHVMFDAYASSKTIYLWAFFSLLFTVGLLFFIVSKWEDATGQDVAKKIETASQSLDELKTARAAEIDAKAKFFTFLAELKGEALEKALSEHPEKEIVEEATKSKIALEVKSQKIINNMTDAIKNGGATEENVLRMVVLLGALGGALHFMASLGAYVGNRQLKRSWLLHYMFMPLVGAVLATMVYMLLRVGILTPSGAASGGSSIANLNLISIYAFAILTGLFAKTATEKLKEVFGTIFRTERSAKDPLTPTKPTS